MDRGHSAVFRVLNLYVKVYILGNVHKFRTFFQKIIRGKAQIILSIIFQFKAFLTLKSLDEFYLKI